MLREISVAIVASVVGLLLTATSSYADGVCKKDLIPLNYVAVAEFYSPECDTTANPFVKNAWEVEPVSEGITVCSLPDRLSIGPKVASMISCETAHSDRCPMRLDGLRNARILPSPAACIAQNSNPTSWMTRFDGSKSR
jgi:hypothetical protein